MAHLLIYPQEAVPLDLKERVIDLLESAWPSERSRDVRLQAPLHDPDYHPIAVMLMEQGMVLSYLAIPSKPIQHAGVTYQASGLSAVVTHPAHRHQGYGRLIVTAAYDVIATSGADIGVFTCDTPLANFYAQCGWTVMEHTTVIGGTREKPFPADPLNKRTLMGFFSAKARQRASDLASGSIYLELREGNLW